MQAYLRKCKKSPLIFFSDYPSTQTVEMSDLQEKLQWLMEIANDNTLGQLLTHVQCIYSFSLRINGIIHYIADRDTTEDTVYM